MFSRMLTLAVAAAGGLLLIRQFRAAQGVSQRRATRGTIDVALPMSRVYDEWTRFTQFPAFIQSVHEVHLHWNADSLDEQAEAEVALAPPVPNKIIAWQTGSRSQHGGRLTFTELDGSRTRVTFEMGMNTRELPDLPADMSAAVEQQIRRSLHLFKERIEQRACDTGRRRGAH